MAERLLSLFDNKIVRRDRLTGVKKTKKSKFCFNCLKNHKTDVLNIKNDLESNINWGEGGGGARVACFKLNKMAFSLLGTGSFVGCLYFNFTVNGLWL